MRAELLLGLALFGVEGASSGVLAPEPPTCKVPWLENGRWTDCQPEYTVPLGTPCTWQKNFGVQCTYPDGPILCNDEGKFELNGQGKQLCVQIPHPLDKKGCARFDTKVGVQGDAPNTSCKSTEGCTWNGDRQWCEFNCRGNHMCGVELHRLSEQCQMNCPLSRSDKWEDECAPWQAGCTCVQDTNTADCATWCTVNNQEEFMHIAPRQTADARQPKELPDYPSLGSVFLGLKTVGAALAMQNEGGYDTVRMCQDACFNRGICVSPPANLIIS